jgi:phage tail-like protein
LKKVKYSVMIIVLVAVVMLANQAFGALIATRTNPSTPTNNVIATNFVTVDIEGLGVVSNIRSISGLIGDTEVVEYQDGEDQILRKRPGRTRYSNIVIKRSYLSSANDPIYLWRKNVVNGTIQRKNGSVIICNQSGVEIGRYNFTDAWPCNWKGPDMDNSKAALLTEEIILAVESIVKVK